MGAGWRARLKVGGLLGQSSGGRMVGPGVQDAERLTDPTAVSEAVWTISVNVTGYGA